MTKPARSVEGLVVAILNKLTVTQLIFQIVQIPKGIDCYLVAYRRNTVESSLLPFNAARHYSGNGESKTYSCIQLIEPTTAN